jgi:hypothetical protein
MDSDFLKSILLEPLIAYRDLPNCRHCGDPKQGYECDTCNQEMAADLATACQFAGCQSVGVECEPYES